MFFLSYARADELKVDALVEDLRQLGEVWRDQQIAGGQNWWREILRRIRGSHLFVFALSEASLASPVCRAELDYAIATRRPILPVQVGPVTYIPRRLGALQIVDYVSGTTRGGVRLARAVRDFDGYHPPLPSPLPWDPEVPDPPQGSRSDAPASRSPRRPAVVLVGVLAVVLVVGGVALLISLGGSNSTGATATSPTSGYQGDSRVALVAAVRDYYGVVVDNPAAGWARLGPDPQRSSGGYSAYQGFWSTISSVEVSSANAVDEDTVRASLVFFPVGRPPVRETHELDLVQGTAGTWLINSDRALPSGS